LDKIMLDYTEMSVVRLFVNNSQEKHVYEGVSEIREMFACLFKELCDLSTLKAPIVDVEEDARQVFLTWECPGCGYATATDTFIFDECLKIARQNIVVTKGLATSVAEGTYAPRSVQQAWDNHFSAFGEQDLDKIMLDYTEMSVVRLFVNNSQEKHVYEGVSEIREMFACLFKELCDLSTLKAPIVDVEEDARQVFLTWECPGCGYATATDTFIFDECLKIARQNIVVTKC